MSICGKSGGSYSPPCHSRSATTRAIALCPGRTRTRRIPPRLAPPTTPACLSADIGREGALGVCETSVNAYEDDGDKRCASTDSSTHHSARSFLVYIERSVIYRGMPYSMRYGSRKRKYHGTAYLASVSRRVFRRCQELTRRPDATARTAPQTDAAGRRCPENHTRAGTIV